MKIHVLHEEQAKIVRSAQKVLTVPVPGTEHKNAAEMFIAASRHIDESESMTAAEQYSSSCCHGDDRFPDFICFLHPGPSSTDVLAGGFPTDTASSSTTTS